jgi:complement component 1 Q subcomponent-binding protein, mitochondrial
MLSIRSFARSAPRAVSRLTSSAIRRPARPASLLQSAWKPAAPRYAAAFSTSTIRRAQAAEGDEELVAKLESEIQVENEMKTDVPTSVKDYLQNGPFKIIDTPGEEEVVLTRTFGDEKCVILVLIGILEMLY